MFLVPSLALAASIQFSPATVSVTAGQSFTVSVIATPSGAPLYTASANLGFDPGILQITNFSFASNWMPVTQAGYDSTDNTSGVLIKTGGFPGGFTGATALGTITFRAKAAGTAAITASGNSMLLDGGSNNELSGPQGSVAVTVTNAPAAQTQNTATVPTPNNSGPIPGQTGTAPVSTGSNAGQAAGVASVISTTTGEAAAAGSIFSHAPSWLWWLLLLLVVLGGGYWIWRTYASNNG